MCACINCCENSIVVDYSEGTYVCTNCGVVQEQSIMLPNKKTNEEDESVEELDNSIPPFVWKETNLLFERIQSEYSYRGQIKKGVYSNCLLRICQSYDLTRTIREISELMNVDSSLMTKTAKHVDEFNSCESTDNNDITGLIPRYLQKLSKSRLNKIELTHTLRYHCSNVYLLEGATPHTRLVTFIYHLVRDLYTKKEICHIFDISSVTLNKTYKKFTIEIAPSL